MCHRPARTVAGPVPAPPGRPPHDRRCPPGCRRVPHPNEARSRVAGPERLVWTGAECERIRDDAPPGVRRGPGGARVPPVRGRPSQARAHAVGTAVHGVGPPTSPRAAWAVTSRPTPGPPTAAPPGRPSRPLLPRHRSMPLRRRGRPIRAVGSTTGGGPGPSGRRTCRPTVRWSSTPAPTNGSVPTEPRCPCGRRATTGRTGTGGPHE